MSKMSLLALVITSLIGNTTALSRLMYAMAKDKILPERYTHLNDQDVPSKSVWLVVGISCFIPLVGRTAIGWIVDVTTIGATLIYCLVSAAASRLGKDTDDRRGMILGCVGLVIMIAFGVYILLPNLIARGSLVKETYFLFIIWSVLGFLFFRSILQRDKAQRFGAAFIVWVVLLALVLFIALIWMRQSMIETNDRLMDNIEGYYAQQQDMDGTRQLDEHFIEDELTKSQDEDTQTMLMAVGMFAFALVIMLTNHSYMNKRSKENEMLANIDPMTGVKSKHAYMVSEKDYDLAITEGRANPFAVMVGDVNGLKKINDALGHKAGDEYIREACRMVCEIFDHSPVYRVGGDEFVVILTGRDYAVRRDLMRVMHDRSVLHINEGGAVISGGLSEYRPEEDKSFHDVFSRADAQMYEEKMLLKGLGAVTRDGSEEEAQAKVEEPAILSIRRQVLVVEDEIVNQQMLGGALQNDYEVLYASDGLEALEIIRENRDNLAVVLLDLNMPRMDGIELLKTIKQDQSLTGISVIVLTSNQNAEVECLKLGAVDFIRKPYPTWEIIQARVNKCVELSENRNIIRSTERDSLTNLFNIDYFLRYVNMYDQHYQDMAMDAIVVDVNHFHMINERYGKQYGDTLLKRIGENVRKVARQIGGVGCRRGADIFLIYCPHREDYVELLDRLSADLDDDTTSGRVRLRMGVYAQVDKSYEIETRFDYAKIASNTVRTGFTKGVGIYDDEMHEKEIFRSRLLEDFRPALESGQFIVHFQPKYDIRQEKPVLSSAEALVRWKHPEYGMLKPNTFIPLLEENGLILQLDQYVWRRSAARIQRWKERFGYALPVSVNVSRVDMLTPNLKNIFADILKEYDLSSKDLVLEITESAYAGDSEQIISTARELRGLGMGFRIEMDDFGAGYSSLAMLAKLPIDVLKLDISFVHNAFGQNRDVRMIELIIDIADYLNVPVVAEGVETEEQYLTLKAMGCDYVQGFYFSEALSPEDFEALLTKSKPQPGDAKAAIRKNWLDITDGMAGRYENIFYIDVNTSFYLEFVAMEDGRLQLRLGGMDFVSDVDRKLLDGVKPEDAQRLRAALTNANLVKWANTDEQTVVTYQKDIGGELKTYAIQTLRTRESDAQHIVIGVKRQ